MFTAVSIIKKSIDLCQTVTEHDARASYLPTSFFPAAPTWRAYEPLHLTLNTNLLTLQLCIINTQRPKMTRSARSCHLRACLTYFTNIADQFTDHHWWQQTVQRSPLSKFTFSRGPCVISQRTAVDISFLFNTFKEWTWNFYSTVLNLMLDLYSVLIEWWKCLCQCFSDNIQCFLTVFKEGSGNSFLRLAKTHHIYQTRCSLDIEVMIVKIRTLHVELFHVFFGAK